MRGNKHLDASGNTWLTANEAVSFEGNDHLMNRRRTDLEMTLDVGFGRWTPKHVRIGVDEGQVLALLFGEALVAGLLCSA